MVVQITISDEDVDELREESSSLDRLLRWLDGLDTSPGQEVLAQRLADLDVEMELFDGLIGTTPDGYQRNVIDCTDTFELVVICWDPGQKTAIHDHGSSDCAFRVIEGAVTETIYTRTDDGGVEATDRQVHVAGDEGFVDEADVHRLSNETRQRASNIHLYMPPVGDGDVYDDPTG